MTVLEPMVVDSLRDKASLLLIKRERQIEGERQTDRQRETVTKRQIDKRYIPE